MPSGCRALCQCTQSSRDLQSNASRAALNKSMSDGWGVEGNGYSCISALEGTKLRCDLHRLRSIALGLCSHLGHSLTSTLPFQSQSSHLTCFFPWDCPNKSLSPRSSSQRLLLGEPAQTFAIVSKIDAAAVELLKWNKPDRWFWEISEETEPMVTSGQSW